MPTGWRAGQGARSRQLGATGPGQAESARMPGKLRADRPAAGQWTLCLLPHRPTGDVAARCGGGPAEGVAGAILRTPYCQHRWGTTRRRSPPPGPHTYPRCHSMGVSCPRKRPTVGWAILESGPNRLRSPEPPRLRWWRCRSRSGTAPATPPRCRTPRRSGPRRSSRSSEPNRAPRRSPASPASLGCRRSANRPGCGAS